jgi:hypothetical protein
VLALQGVVTSQGEILFAPEGIAPSREEISLRDRPDGVVEIVPPMHVVEKD